MSCKSKHKRQRLAEAARKYSNAYEVKLGAAGDADDLLQAPIPAHGRLGGAAFSTHKRACNAQLSLAVQAESGLLWPTGWRPTATMSDACREAGASIPRST